MRELLSMGLHGYWLEIDSLASVMNVAEVGRVLLGCRLVIG
jgi:hypothetical protein